jgi:hypothetical protein
MKMVTKITQLMAVLAAVLWMAQGTNAQTIKLKITYNGAGVANNKITVKSGDAVIGTGRTDQGGNVSISAHGSFPKLIDVYGDVSTPSEEKTWDVKQYCELDDNNFFHLKMEEVLALFSEMMDPEIIAEAWGLVFSTGGASNGGHTVNNGGNGGGNSGNDDRRQDVEAPKPVEPPKPTYPPGYNCNPVSGSVVNAAKSKMEQESFSSGKLSVAKDAIRGNCMEASQIKTLVELLPMSAEKMELAKYGYEYVANPGGYSVVESALSNSFEREDLRKYTEGKSGKSTGGTNGSASKSDTENAHHSNLPPTNAPGAIYTLTVFAEAGEKFIVYIDGKQQNTTPESNVVGQWKDVQGAYPHFRIVFEDSKIPTIEKKMMVGGYSTEMTYKIKKNNKGEYVLKM